jgi:hypothetical protein
MGLGLGAWGSLKENCFSISLLFVDPASPRDSRWSQPHNSEKQFIKVEPEP